MFTSITLQFIKFGDFLRIQFPILIGPESVESVEMGYFNSNKGIKVV